MRLETFGQYTLLKRLGAGGMGEVFLAKTKSGELITVKRILPHLTENPRFLRLFLDETRIASRLVHPNIARIHEFGGVAGKNHSVKIKGKFYLTRAFAENRKYVSEAVRKYATIKALSKR